MNCYIKLYKAVNTFPFHIIPFVSRFSRLSIVREKDTMCVSNVYYVNEIERMRMRKEKMKYRIKQKPKGLSHSQPHGITAITGRKGDR